MPHGRVVIDDMDDRAILHRRACLGSSLQGEAKHGSAAGVGLGPHLAAMRLDDAFGDRQSDAHARGLGGDEGLKQAIGNLLGDARAGVGDADLDHIAVNGLGRHQQFSPLAVMHGLDGVAHEIEQHLLDLNLVHQHRVGVALEAEQGLDPLVLGADQGQRARFFDQLADILGPLLGFAARRRTHGAGG